MKENALAHVRKIGKIGQIIMNISKAVVILGIVLLTAATIGLACMPDDSFKFDYSVSGALTIDADKLGIALDENDAESNLIGNVSVSKINLQLNDATVDDGKMYLKSSHPAEGTISSANIIYILILCDAILAISLVSLFFAASLCKAFTKCESPFDSDVINKMRNFAFSLIPWVLMNSVSNSVSSILNKDEMYIRVTVDLKMVVVVLSVLSLTAIFKYGAILQKESDETL